MLVFNTSLSKQFFIFLDVLKKCWSRLGDKQNAYWGHLYLTMDTNKSKSVSNKSISDKSIFHEPKANPKCINWKPIISIFAYFWNSISRSLSDYSWTRTHSHLVHKRTLNHLAKSVKWLSCVVGTFLYGAFDCIFLSCYLGVSEWMHTL